MNNNDSIKRNLSIGQLTCSCHCHCCYHPFPETGNDRNCAGCRTCCLDYACWLKTQDILFAIINDTFFDVIVTLCIILNTIFLAIEHHGMSEELGHILDLGNKVFTTFFALEAVLKLAALSREYFGNGWNIFDLVTWNQDIILTMIMIIINHNPDHDDYGIR